MTLLSDDVIGKIVGEIEALGCGIPENFFQCQQEPGAHKVSLTFNQQEQIEQSSR